VGAVTAISRLDHSRAIKFGEETPVKERELVKEGEEVVVEE